MAAHGSPAVDATTPRRRGFKRPIALALGAIVIVVAVLAVVICLPTDPPAALIGELHSQAKRHRHRIRNRDAYILVDFDRPLFRKRLWVIDARNDAVLFNWC